MGGWAADHRSGGTAPLQYSVSVAAMAAVPTRARTVRRANPNKSNRRWRTAALRRPAGVDAA